MMRKGTQENAEAVQNAINFLVCKAKNKLTFDEDEKEFCKELFETFWWGGQWQGTPEAATLANHYVNGSGDDVKFDGDMYKESRIVKDVMLGMKLYIAKKLLQENKTLEVQNNDTELVKESYYKQLFRGNGRSSTNEGWLIPDKNYVILTEQSNRRLKRADNRFFLKSTSTVVKDDLVKTKWSVVSLYDFEPFDGSDTALTDEDKKHVTDLSILPNLVIKLPDGLSHYITTDKVEVAKDFTYTSEWTEYWEIKK